MKSFKSHISERSKDLKEFGIYEAQNMQEVMEVLSKANDNNMLKVLGAGVYSMAVQGQQGKLVVKIPKKQTTGKYYGEYEDPWIYFAQIAQKKAFSNPHYPRIGFLNSFMHLPEKGFVAVLEQLQFGYESSLRAKELLRADEWFDPPPSAIASDFSRHGLANIVYQFVREIQERPIKSDYYEKFFEIFTGKEGEQWKEIFQDIAALMLSGGYALDIHSNNIAVRNNKQVVIVDPLS